MLAKSERATVLGTGCYSVSIVGAEGRRLQAAGPQPTRAPPPSVTHCPLESISQAGPGRSRRPAFSVQRGSSSMGEQPKKKLVLLASARFFFFPSALFSGGSVAAGFDPGRPREEGAGAGFDRSSSPSLISLRI